MYKTIIKAKARFLKQFGISDTEKVIRYFTENMEGVTKKNAEIRLDNLSKTIMKNYFNGDITFVRQKGE